MKDEKIIIELFKQ